MNTELTADQQNEALAQAQGLPWAWWMTEYVPAAARFLA
jgi:hypothetical protein